MPAGNNNTGGRVYSYDKDAKTLRDFFTQFKIINEAMIDDDILLDGNDVELFKYKDILQDVANRKKSTIQIELDDLIEWNIEGIDLAEKIEENTLRYLEIAYETVDSILPNPSLSNTKQDVVDILLQQRQERLQNIDNTMNNNLDENDENNKKDSESVQLPQALKRRYEIVFLSSKRNPPKQLRHIKASSIGKLVKLQGIVTRMSEVKPLLTIATYTCTECGHENYQEVKSREFMPLNQCGSRACLQRKVKGTLELQTRGSKFIKFQEIKLQELPDQVPIGHTPRSMTIHTMGELTRLCAAGDIATITGVFLPTPYSGWQALRAGLIADTYLQAMHIEKQIKNYASYEITDKMLNEITRLSKERGVYERLASSIAPEIFGHEDVKKALLLLMVGASTRELPDGMKIRGDINICLMGDPGVAKSQLLRHISSITPRGVYTSGKGASGVGLTAAVVRDPITREFVLEGGSLVLSDMGICCIDEFDKMEESDRTAIHEVMEQQTISIAKAGINTTLNARTSILAAANPAYGRYNPKRSPAENINLPAALLSRFDLLFLILDKPDYERDLALATHVTYVHMNGKHPESEHLNYTPVSTETMRCYIAQARKYNPYIPNELTQYIVSAYVKIRQMEASSPDQHAYTTARTLLSILRLSQALARLCLRDVVLQSDVDEAIRLLDVSQSTLEEDRNKTTSNVDPISGIYDIIRNLAVQNEEIQIQMSDIIPRVLAKGFTQNQLQQCLDEYERFQVWTVASDQTFITFV